MKLGLILLLVPGIIIGNSCFAFVPIPLVFPSRTCRRQHALESNMLLLKTSAASTVVVDPLTALVDHNNNNDNDNNKPLLEITMEKIKLPRLAVGKDCVTIPLHIDGLGPYEFHGRFWTNNSNSITIINEGNKSR